MSDDSGPMLHGHSEIWAALVRDGHALTDDKEVGLAPKFRENFVGTYFTDRVLRRDPGDWPVDRQRARDVVRYQWYGDELTLREHEEITITNRAGIPGRRDHARVKLLSDPQAEELVRAFLSLVPPGRRLNDGTFGINLFRTFTDVVTTPHSDYEEFVILYVLDRVGQGAESYLYRASDVASNGQPSAGPVFTQQLDPGQILIFEDRLFKHGATPLEPPHGGKAKRDALVCTIDYESTYLHRGQ